MRFPTKRRYFVTLNSLHRFVTYDTICLSENYSFETQPFLNFFRTNLNSSIIVASNIILLHRNRIYHKMQLEKLYKLQNEVCCNCILFVFENRKTLCDQFLLLWKISRIEFRASLNIKRTERK